MTSAIRFGKLETITVQGPITITQSEKIHNYDTAIQLTRTTVDIMADSHKKMLAEVLKLTERIKTDDSVTEIAFECKKRVDNAIPYKMSVSWVSK